MGKIVKKESEEYSEVKLYKSPYEMTGGPAKYQWKNEIWYEGTGQIFTDEEIEESDKKFRKQQEDALPEILADGFIEYPLFFKDREGEMMELKAWLHPSFEPSCSEGFFEKHGMDTNIYVPSYERAGKAKTIDLWRRMGVENYYICIDPQQYSTYKEHYPIEKLVIRDIEFRRTDMLEGHSSLKRPMNMAGHAPLCNFTLALSRSLGEEYFTFADDDFVGLAMKAHIPNRNFNPKFEKYDKNNFYRCSDIKPEYGFSFQEFWHGLEKLIEHSRNPGFVGLERFGTVFSIPVSFKYGSRVYSLYLTKNDTQITHSSRQNNDVNTSIDLSKHGMVNLLFEGVSYNSEATQAGGGQSQMYKRLGTYDKSKNLVRAQPNCTKVIDRYSRIHHSGDYTFYNKQRIVGAPIKNNDNKEI